MIHYILKVFIFILKPNLIIMEEISSVKYCIGPMSKNIVNAIIEYVNKNNIKMILIPSRRQIEYNGGYVNNWNTEEFCLYVRSKTKNIYLERDHGGPGQGTNMDDGLESFKKDAKLLDIIHIDPWKKYQDYNEGLKHTIDLINYCYNLNKNIYFEVATEEAIRPFTVQELRQLMIDLKSSLDNEVYQRIVYLVIQSGTALKEGVNTGVYNNERLKDMMKLSEEFNILTKEHNGDWITDEEIKDKFENGLNSLNIAPEFGMIETKVILKEIDNLDSKVSEELFETFFKICYESKKWVKWVKEDFDPFKNKRKLIEICGHYVFPDERIKFIKSKLEDIDKKINSYIF
jgi:fructose/tagatose bisphosphate aldolase